MMKTPPKPGLGLPVRRRPQHAHWRTSRAILQHGVPGAPDRRDGVRMRGAPFMLTQLSLKILPKK